MCQGFRRHTLNLKGNGQPSVHRDECVPIKNLLAVLISWLSVIESCAKSMHEFSRHCVLESDFPPVLGSSVRPSGPSSAGMQKRHTSHTIKLNLRSTPPLPLTPLTPNHSDLLNVPSDKMLRCTFNLWPLCFPTAGRSWGSSSRQSTTGICWLPGPSGPSDQTPRGQTSL